MTDPTIIEPTDIIVRIDTSTICGSDPHILKGDVPETPAGTVLGHEAVGTAEELGASVTSVEVGDRVLLSCISACGRCRFCKESRYGLCLGGGGWILGHLINGVQAEYARIPFADNSVYKLPDALSDEQVLFLADILPTSYEVGVLNGMVEPGDTVAIVGAGPVGLAAILTARLYTPGRIVSIDLADSRLGSATRLGADSTHPCSPPIGLPSATRLPPTTYSRMRRARTRSRLCSKAPPAATPPAFLRWPERPSERLDCGNVTRQPSRDSTGGVRWSFARFKPRRATLRLQPCGRHGW